MKNIKGFFRKPEEQKQPDFASAMLGTAQLFQELKDVKTDIIKTTDEKISEVNDVIKEAKDVVKEGAKKLDDKISEIEDTAVAVIKEIKNIPTIKGEQGEVGAKGSDGKDGKDAPTIDEGKLINKLLKAIPENKASLKVIRETLTVDPLQVAKQIMELPVESFILKMSQVDGLDQAIRLLQHNSGKGGYVHGGGFNNIYDDGVLVAPGLTGLNFTGSGVTSVTKNATTGIITVDIDGGGGSGTVTDVSVVSANGFAGTVATSTTTPAITLSTTITGILQGNGTAISAITVGSGLSFAGGTLSATGGGIGGTIAVTQVAYGSDTDEIKGEAAFVYDDTTNTLSVENITLTRIAEANGSFDFYNIGGNLSGILDFGSITSSNKTYTFPDATGTLALTSDLGSYLPLAGGTMVGDILMTSNKIIGGSTTTSDLFLQTTSGVGTTGADMHFLVGNNGATEAMTILNNGNVGIGTTGPGSKLDIVGTGNALRLSSNRTNATLKFGILASGHYTNAEEDAAMIYSSNTSSENQLYIGGGTTQVNASSYISFWTAANNTTVTGTERMRILAGGDVGIGLTDPGARLELSKGNNVLGLFRITQRVSGGAAYGLDVGLDTSTGNPTFSGIANNVVTHSFSIGRSTGNVGIGTTAPDKVLEINLGTTNAFRLTYNDANGSATTYMDTTVSSAGLTTFTGAGSAPSFAFAQDVALGTNSLTLTGSIAATGARVTKGWFTDIESTNMPTVGGTALDDTLKDGGTYEIDAAELGSGASTDGQVLTSDGAGGAAWENAAGGGVMTLLKAGSGTDTSNATPVNLDTIALTGLTALDTIMVYVSLEATGQIALTPGIYNATDDVDITVFANVASGNSSIRQANARQAQSANTKVLGMESSAFATTDIATFTTAWTGSWTLALRYGGMNGAGGTLNWSWSVYKIAGQ